MNNQQACTGCGFTKLYSGFCLKQQPVVMNYRFRTAADSRRIARRDVELAQCKSCGLVFNKTFEADAVPYDENYENRQSFSAAFQSHLNTLADVIIKRGNLKGGRVLEVGCGKGDFLRLVCEKANAAGVGYDTTYEGSRTSQSGRIRFHQRYVYSADIKAESDVIICRHVVEHIPAIGSFLRELHAIALASGNPLVVIETPSLEWIVENGCFLDLFYEHCNYFSMRCLAYLCRQAGFVIKRHTRVFSSQYQMLELRLSKKWPRKLAAPGIDRGASLRNFPKVMLRGQKQVEKMLLDAGSSRGWAVWGAGGKGVALINQLTIEPPKFVVDSNPAKQGCVIPGTSVPIISPEDSRLLQVPVVLVVNPNYLDEIKTLLCKRGFTNTLLSL